MDSSDGEPPPQSGKSSQGSVKNQASPAPISRGSQTPLPAQRSSGRVRQKPKGYSPEAPEIERKRTPSPLPPQRPPSAAKALKAVAPSPKPTAPQKLDVSRAGSVDTLHAARARQKTLKRFSPSPPPSKKARRSPNASVERQIHTETFSLTELKESFFVEGVIPKIEFTLPFNLDEKTSDDDMDRETPPPVSVKRIKAKGVKAPTQRGTPTPSLGIVKLPKPKKLVEAAKIAAAAIPDGAAEESTVSSLADVASTSKSPAPPRSKPRAAAGREQQKDDVPSAVTPSGRPARKAAAGVRDLVAQIRPKTPPPPEISTAEPPKAAESESDETPSSPVAPVVRLSDMAAPPMSPAPSPVPTSKAKKPAPKASVPEPTSAPVERPKRASRSISRSSVPSVKEESPQRKIPRAAPPSSSPTDSAEEPAIRRSSRQSAPTSKVLDMRRPSTVRSPATAVVKIKPKPGSALEIKKKTAQFRVNRSPTPETSTSAPVTPKNTSEKAKKKEAEKEVKKEVVKEEVLDEELALEPPLVIDMPSEGTPEVSTEQEEPPQKEAPSVVEKEAEELAVKEEKEVEEAAPEPLDVSHSGLVVPEVAEGDKDDAERSFEAQPLDTTTETDDVKLEMADTTAELAESIMDTTMNETLPSEGGAVEQTAPAEAEQPPPAVTDTEQPPAPSPGEKEKPKAKGKPTKSAPKAPVPVATPARRSGRGFKPNKLFEDFVGPETVNQTIRTSEPEVIKVPAKHPKRKAPSPKPPAVPRPLPEESAAEKTRKHVNENRPMKLLMKLGSEVSTRVVGAEEPPVAEEGEAMEVDEQEQPSETSTRHLLDLMDDLDDEEPSSTGDAMSTRSTKPKKDGRISSRPTWWTNYTPSEKPILENYIRPDGTIEKMGVTINSVMDKILLAVCQDGITRNSNAHSRANKSKQLLELAKQRYSDKKKFDDGKRAEALAQGKEYVESPLAKKTTSELFAHTIATRDRTKKAALYKQNEYIQKPVKLAKEHESEKEKSERKALDYLSKQFNREAEEDLRHGREGQFYKPRKAPKPVKKVSFADFVTAKAPGAREMLIPTVRAPDTFYRELLRPDDEDLDVTDGDVDIVAGADEPIPELSIFEQTATEAANKIAALLLRPQSADGSFDVSGLYLRIQEEAMERRGLCDFVMNDVVEFFVTQSSSLGEPGCNVLHNEALRHANALQAAFARCTQESSVWTHRFLLENLPVSYLISYLILLRYLKYTAGSSFTNLLLKPLGDDYQPWPRVTEIIARYIASKPLDPDREDLQSTITPNCLSDVLFVMVPPCFSYGDCTVKGKAHDVMYRWLKSVGDNDSVTVELDFSERNDSVIVAAETMIRCVKEKIQKLVKERRDKRIVLVGWNVTCYFNHRVVQLTHGVSAIIDFAFPLRTEHGWRGTADDDILLTYCPSLFIVGSEASDFNPYALKELRSGMICENGAVVIHDADDDLNVQMMTLNTIGITQRTVYRSILETVIDFLQQDFTKKERSQLIQHELNCIYDLDVEGLSKSRRDSGQTGLPTPRGRPPAGAKPHAEKVAKPRKRKHEAAPLKSQPSTMPLLQAEPIVGSISEIARTNFQDILKRATDDYKRPEEYMNMALGSFSRPVVKASPLPSPAIPKSSARSGGPELLDPANISLN